MRNLARRIAELERAYDLAPETSPSEAIDFAALTVEELLWLEEPWRGVPNDPYSIARNPEAAEEFMRRLDVMAEELESRR